MKFKFKTQSYQTNAVNSVVDCFNGQNYKDNLNDTSDTFLTNPEILNDNYFKNKELNISDHTILSNIKSVQNRQNLIQSSELIKKSNCLNLDIEMETGTGKTYCYIKTIFELNKKYGWSKFIIIVPTIAIREGVFKSFEITSEHFAESYNKKARFFKYNSRRLHEIESFSSDSGINVMIINIQAFNARGADNRRIYDELDDFQSRRPIDVIMQCNPILILDEPQKMEGSATLNALPQFNPLFILRYSATHATQHNLIHRLDAVDAYNQKLVKKIEVRGIQPKGLDGSGSYLYLESIEISKNAPIARLEFEIKLRNGSIKKQIRKISYGDNLYKLSNEMEQYKDRFIVSQIDKNDNSIEFSNGILIKVGEAYGDLSEIDIRRIQIRETISSHLEKELLLYSQGIKVLSLFFIDQVKKYRDYDQADEKGIYAKIFEEEYQNCVEDFLNKKNINDSYLKYIKDIDPLKTHNGYFSIDRKTKRLIDPTIDRNGEAKEVDAYELILKDKEKLLSFEENTRFIFSHSALSEGWDNPNVFVMCMLKHSNNEIKRRQEVGRGLRLCVTQSGERIYNPNIVHEINQLTVVANESYHDFVNGLQHEIIESLSSRPRIANQSYFIGKVIHTNEGEFVITESLAAQIYRYLVKNDYTNEVDEILPSYHDAKNKNQLAPLPEVLKPYSEGIFSLINSVFSDGALPKIGNARSLRKNQINENINMIEFKELWNRINKKAVYKVNFKSSELIEKSIKAINEQLIVTPLSYKVDIGSQKQIISSDEMRSMESFSSSKSRTVFGNQISSNIKYDLLGKIANETNLLRKTIAKILEKIENFNSYKENPEQFIFEVSRIINEQKSTMIVEKLEYRTLDDSYSIDIFTANQSTLNFNDTSELLKKHVYDFVVTDSDVEKNFVKELDNSDEVIVYAKLPKGFLIPTPVGDYNPDWAISFKENDVKHIYFVAETKGSMSSMDLRQIEKSKIKCAKKYFEELGSLINHNKVKYDVVTDFDKLMDIVSRP